MSRRTLLFDARLVLDKPTGIGQYIMSLVPELLRQAPDWQIHLLRRRDPWPGYGLDGWSAPNLCQHVSSVGHMSPRQEVAVPLLARRLAADVVHYPHFDAPVSWRPAPVVATLHDAKYLTQPHFFPRLSRARQRYMWWRFRHTLRRAAAVIAVSHHTAQDLRMLFGTPLRDIDVIESAPDPMFRPASADEAAAVREEYDLRRPFLLSVGERRPHKNHVGLIRAYAGSGASASHDLVIVGQPYDGYDEPERAASLSGVGQHIHFLSDVDSRQLIALYTLADLFVLLSFYEGFGLPLLEAMSCATPVLAANTTATAEVAASGARLVDPVAEDEVIAALDELLADAPAREALRDAGQAWAARFTWSATAAATLDVYRRVIASGERVPAERAPGGRAPGGRAR